jgi:hypothetical protein
MARRNPLPHGLSGFLVRVETPDGRTLDGVAFSKTQREAEARADTAWAMQGYKVLSVTKLPVEQAERLLKTGRLNPPTRKAQAFIGRKIRRLAREGMQAPRRVAAAYSLARRAGFKIPKRARKNPRGCRNRSAPQSDGRCMSRGASLSTGTRKGVT